MNPLSAFFADAEKMANLNEERVGVRRDMLLYQLRVMGVPDGTLQTISERLSPDEIFDICQTFGAAHAQATATPPPVPTSPSAPPGQFPYTVFCRVTSNGGTATKKRLFRSHVPITPGMKLCGLVLSHADETEFEVESIDVGPDGNARVYLEDADYSTQEWDATGEMRALDDERVQEAFADWQDAGY